VFPSRIHLATTAALTVALALAALAPRPAAACSVCACGDPLASAGEAPAMAGALRLSLDGEWLRVESDETPGETNRLTQQSLRLSAVYSPLERLNLVLGVPITSKELSSLSTGERLGDESGLGDLDVGVRWFPFTAVDMGARRAQSLGLSLGASLPTGSRKDVALLDEHGQLGTGSWGPYAGLLYRFGQGDFAAVASLTGRLRTENSDGYRYGNALLWSVQGEWDPHPRVALALGLDGREAWADVNDEGDVPSTGGLVLALAPAASFNVTAGFWVTVKAQLPVVKQLRGQQDVAPTVNVGLQWQVF
jgi:hypothetical protein